MNYKRPIVLSIAGFDPTAGAGVLADIKTFEQHHCLGMAVNTAITNQVEDKFDSVKWFTAKEIIHSIKTLLGKYKISFVKIGIIENLKTLSAIVGFLKKENENIVIVWDPVLSASSGFQLIKSIDKTQLNKVLSQIFLITPNVIEAKSLSGLSNEFDAASHLSKSCNVLLKGGHSTTEKGVDYLFQHNKKVKIKNNTTSPVYPKHGSGCILSSAIIANLALGDGLHSACKNSKQYIEIILKSNKNLLSYHAA